MKLQMTSFDSLFESDWFTVCCSVTKIRFVLREQIQIIGMSATLPNLEHIARWMDGTLYVTRNRPVTLTQFLRHIAVSRVYEVCTVYAYLHGASKSAPSKSFTH